MIYNLGRIRYDTYWFCYEFTWRDLTYVGCGMTQEEAARKARRDIRAINDIIKMKKRTGRWSR